MIRIILIVGFCCIIKIAHATTSDSNKERPLKAQLKTFTAKKQYQTLTNWRVKHWKQLVIQKQKLASIDEAHVYGLFSYGGWSDQGQYFLIVPNKAKSILWYTDNNSLDFKNTFIAKKDRPLNVIKNFNLQDLKRIAYDAISFQFIAAMWHNNSITITHMSYFVAPMPDNDAPYLSLVKAFEQLKNNK